MLIQQPHEAVAVNRQRGVGRVWQREQVAGRPGDSTIQRSPDVDGEACGRWLIGTPGQVNATALAGSRIDGNRQSATQSLLAVLGQAKAVKSELHPSGSPHTHQAIRRVLEIFAWWGASASLVIPDHHHVCRYLQCSRGKIAGLRSPAEECCVDCPIWVKRWPDLGAVLARRRAMFDAHLLEGRGRRTDVETNVERRGL